MDVLLVVPTHTDIRILGQEYPDLVYDYDYEGEGTDYFIGESSDGGGPDEWLTYDEAVAFCGFAEGAIPGASTIIEGNGFWAQGLLSLREVPESYEPEDRAERERYAAIWWEAHARGVAAREKAGSPC